MNTHIISSNKLLVDFLDHQKHGRSDCSEQNHDAPLQKRRRVQSVQSSTHQVPSKGHDLTCASNAIYDANSPALCTVGHDSEACPSVDDVLSLFGENDIDDDVVVNQNEAELNEQNAFVDLVASATSMATITGPPITAHLAETVNKKFQTELETSQRKGLLDKYHVPENCSDVHRPRVNQQVWSSLRADAKAADKALAALQDAVITATSAVAISLEDIIKSHKDKSSLDCQAIAARQLDIVTLLGFISKELSFRRKDAMRSTINPEYRAACSRNIKPTKFLFGDDITKTPQEAKAANRMMKTLPARTPRRGANDRSSYRYQQPLTNSFLSQRGRVQYPPRRTQQQRWTPNNSQRRKFTNN